MMQSLVRNYEHLMGSISRNFQGKFKREIDLGVFDEILGIFIGFIYVRYFIEYNVVQEDQIAWLYVALLLSLTYILFFVALAHSNNDSFKLLVASSLTFIAFAVFQGYAYFSSRSMDITYGDFLQFPEAEIFQVTWFACLAWFFLKFVAERVLKYLQTFSLGSLENSSE